MLSWTSKRTPVWECVICEVGRRRARAGGGYSIELRPSSSAASWPRCGRRGRRRENRREARRRRGGAAVRGDLFDGRLTYDGADALLRRGALGAKRVVDVDATAWRVLLKGGRIPLRDLPAEMMEMSPGTAVARHGGSSITLWRGAADAVTVMVRGDDERLRRGCPADRSYLRYAAVAVAAMRDAVMRRRRPCVKLNKLPRGSGPPS